MQSLAVSFMFVVAVAHAAVVKKPFLKAASELQREIQKLSSELTNEPLQKDGRKTREIQTEVEFMVNRVKSLHDKDLTSEFTNEIEAIEESLAKETTDSGLTTEINEVRASLCAQNGFENHDFASCEAFMRKSCAPADTADSKYSDAAPLEDFCLMFFREEASAGVGQDLAKAVAPAPGPAAGPGGAPGPAPMGPFFGGKSLRALPDQGVTGQLVRHRDFDTMAEDWQKEFGPKAGHRNFDEICADFPDNQWCRIHGYHPREPRKTKVLTKTVEVPGEEQEINTVVQVEKEPQEPPAEPVVRSGTKSCQLTLTALLAAVAMFAK
jgi:hypothetical protein